MASDNHPREGEQDYQAVPEQVQRPSETIPAPVQTLAAYSQERANMNDVMRSLISHRNWLAPLTLFAQNSEETRVVAGMFILSTEAQITPGELWVFTDSEAALRAQAAGALLGAYASGMTGTELFRNVPPDTKTVRVNPGSPREYTWIFQDGGGIEAGKIWADAIALEDSFEQWLQTGKPDKTAFINYRAFLTFDHSSGPVITLPNQSGMLNPAVAFTAPDCADMFLSKLSEEQRTQMRQVTIDGNTLLEKASLLGIDGVIINVFGPGAAYALPFNSISSTH
ncbi:MAG: hypothetical protein LC754_06570 [Acidobacteria bacterium]|nr:hypothetical protein [Acidobacteriota bacterium]